MVRSILKFLTMDELETPKPKPARFKVELVIALSAIFVSLATLVVYIYQARIMIKQAEIMQSQQHISVWPHLESTTSVTSVNGVPNEGYFEIENKGIGPAIVKRVVMKVNGVVMKDNNELFRALAEADTSQISTTGILNRVIAPGEKIRAFHVVGSELVTRFAVSMQKKKFEYIICYCSVYNDCWISNGNVVEEGECK
jgi:hypothetical protein